MIEESKKIYQEKYKKAILHRKTLNDEKIAEIFMLKQHIQEKSKCLNCKN